jgi:trimethylamine--corrinoid protein Co-methyltransferase
MVDPYAEPDHRGSAAALAHHYGLPMFSLAGGSDAKVVDQQAAAEAALTMLVDALGGGHLIHDSGYLESGRTGSLAQLAICDEIAAWIRAAIAPIEISDETLALDLIDELGPHFRERWYPTLIERASHGAWTGHGSMTMAERAAARVDALLEGHKPPPLPDAVAAAIDEILKRASANSGLSPH